MYCDEEENLRDWVKAYERTWESLQEDERGSLKKSVQKAKGEKYRNSCRSILKLHPTCISMIRHIIIIIDSSISMEKTDFRPTRLRVVIKLLESFLSNFFDQNPISQAGIVITFDSSVKTICSLTSQDTLLKESLNQIKTSEGTPSLQNSIEKSLKILEHSPASASKEILIIYGSTSTCDPGDIYESFNKLNDVCVSVISLSCEMFILKYVTDLTGGRHDVAIDEHHFRDCLSLHLSFPRQRESDQSDSKVTLIRLGFPAHMVCSSLSVCLCHLEASRMGYFCPQCQAKYCSLPVECEICGLLLAMAPHLARSYQRYFPLNSFQEINVECAKCMGCNELITDSVGFVCDRCEGVYCEDCDITTHDTLAFCPACSLEE